MQLLILLEGESVESLRGYPVQVIQRMSPEKRRILANNVQELVTNIRAEDVATIMALLAGDVVLRQRILSKIVQTVEEQANLRVSNFVM